MPNEPDEGAPTLSVTVLNYNYAHYLPQCLDSILHQTLTDFELILINDRSTDNSVEVIQPYLADPRIKFINHEVNTGYVASLIEGSERSRGKYMTVISADDFCVSNRAFETMLRPLEADQDIVLSYTAHGRYTPEGVCVYHRCPHPESFVRSGVEEFRDLVLENYILHSGAIIRTSAYHAVGGYDPTTRFAADYILWLALCGQGKVAYSADELSAYRVHGESMSISTKGISEGMREHIVGVKNAFARMKGAPGVTDALYEKAIKRGLTAAATDYIFGSHLRQGWYAYWCGVRINPLWTIFQTRTLILIMRTLLGPRYFDRARSLLKRQA